MAGEANVELAARAYAAFAAGDAAGAMENIADDIEWTTSGNSTISGTIHGKEADGALWAQLAGQGFTVTPAFWFSDEERVVALVETTLAGQAALGADVLWFRDGKLVAFQGIGDTALLERVFGTK